MSQFGKKRLVDFYVDPTYININHASYGYCPKVVMQHKRQLEEQCEFNTQKWFRVDSEIMINQMRSYVASKINCPTKNVYLVQNATDAINSLVKSMKWTEGDVILLTNTTYSCVRKTVMWLQQKYGVSILDLNFTSKDLQSPESIQIKVQDFVNSYPKKIKLAVLDHIISVPGIICPVDSLSQFFSQKNIPLFIDGAHAVGQLHINIAEINPSAYFSNFHKWAFAPKNAAFLYLNDKFLNLVKPAITGNFYGQGPARQYFWTGTRDLTSYLCIKKGFEYLQSFGLYSVASYNHSLVVAGAKRMAAILGTQVLTQDERCIGNLSNVRLPSDDANLCYQISLQMMKNDNCFPAVFSFDGHVWVRIAAQIFNQLSDYQYAAQTFLKYLKKSKQNNKTSIL